MLQHAPAKFLSNYMYRNQSNKGTQQPYTFRSFKLPQSYCQSLLSSLISVKGIQFNRNTYEKAHEIHGVQMDADFHSSYSKFVTLYLTKKL